MYPLGGVFCRRGAAKLVEQGASYSEGYMRYPHGLRQSAIPAIRMAFRQSAIPAIRMALLVLHRYYIGISTYFLPVTDLLADL